ncbi:MAG: hypothetical protein ABH869_02100 [Candidatus Omnitrophota bacterium]
MKRKMKLTGCIGLSLLAFFCISICNLSAQEQNAPTEETTNVPEGGAAETIEKKIENLDLSVPKEEIARRLQALLHFNLDIAAGIEGLQHEQTEAGDVFMYNGTKIQDLDRSAMDNLLRIVQQQLSMKNLQRTQQQMRALKQIQDINKISQTQKQIKNLQQMQNMSRTQRQLKQTTAPSIPKISKIPRAPKTYRAPKRY